MSPITTSDNNYDMGELWLQADDDWRVIGPTADGPQAYNPGGEVVMWQSRDQGATWTEQRQLTHDSPKNHTYVRRVLNAHPDFIAIWADGHGRKPSDSRYISPMPTAMCSCCPRRWTVKRSQQNRFADVRRWSPTVSVFTAQQST